MHRVCAATSHNTLSAYREKNHMTYFSIASIFYIMANFLAIFWNFQLFDRNLCLALVATVLGPVSRHIFVEIMPSSRTRSISDGIQQPEGWRNSDEEDTEEIKNFTLIFAAMFEGKLRPGERVHDMQQEHACGYVLHHVCQCLGTC